MMRLLTMLFALLLAGPVQAGVIYHFTTTQKTAPGGGDFPNISMLMEVSDAAVRQGFLRTNVGGEIGEPVRECVAEGILSFGFRSTRLLPLCPPPGDVTTAERSFGYDLQLVGPFLTGSFFFQTADDGEEVRMTSVRPNLWHGRYGSDALTRLCGGRTPHTCLFEGVWRRAEPVTEPGPLGLLAVGLVALLLYGTEDQPI